MFQAESEREEHAQRLRSTGGKRNGERERDRKRKNETLSEFLEALPSDPKTRGGESEEGHVGKGRVGVSTHPKPSHEDPPVL